MQVELHFDHNLHRYRVTVIHRRLELVLTNCLDRLFVQAHRKMLCYMHVLRIALGIDDQLNGAGTLEAGPLRSRLVNLDGPNDRHAQRALVCFA